MTCNEFRQCRHEYQDAILDDRAMTEAQAHLAGCRECRAIVERDIVLARALEKAVAPLALSPACKRTMAQGIRRRSDGDRVGTAPTLRALAWGFGAALAGALLIAVQLRSPRAGATPAETADYVVDVSTQAPTRMLRIGTDTVVDAVVRGPEVCHADFTRNLTRNTR